MEYKYRIEERFLSDGSKEYMPQRCEVQPRQSMLQKMFDVQPQEHWSNIAAFQNQEYDRGYATMERAMQDIESDKAKRQPTVSAVRTYDEEQLYAILHPHD